MRARFQNDTTSTESHSLHMLAQLLAKKTDDTTHSLSLKSWSFEVAMDGQTQTGAKLSPGNFTQLKLSGITWDKIRRVG